MVRILKNTLPLQVFIRRAQVIQTYRQLLRATRPCTDAQLKLDLQQQIKVEYRRNQHLEDNNLIRSCVSDATKAVKKVQDICTPFAVSQFTQKTSASASTTAHSNTSKANHTAEAASNSKQGMKKDPTSWLGVEDEIDPRGRVGEGWPWQS